MSNRELKENIITDIRSQWKKDGSYLFIPKAKGLSREIVIANWCTQSSQVLLLSHGDNMSDFNDLSVVNGLKMTQLTADLGQVISSKRLEKVLDSKSYDMVIINYVDPITGVRADVNELCEVISKKNTTVVIDASYATIDEILMLKDTSVDVLFANTTKALNTNDTFELIWLSDSILESRQEESIGTPVYLDIKNWLLIDNNELLNEAVMPNAHSNVSHSDKVDQFHETIGVHGYGVLARKKNKSQMVSCLILPRHIRKHSELLRINLQEKGLQIADAKDELSGSAMILRHDRNFDFKVAADLIIEVTSQL